jgi:hypothetical protein
VKPDTTSSMRSVRKVLSEKVAPGVAAISARIAAR